MLSLHNFHTNLNRNPCNLLIDEKRSVWNIFLFRSSGINVDALVFKSLFYPINLPRVVVYMPDTNLSGPFDQYGDKDQQLHAAHRPGAP